MSETYETQNSTFSFCVATARGKLKRLSVRGIVPLKATRADVERRFGKPNKWGNYEFKDERVSFQYGDGPCRDLYVTLGRDNCKCLVPEGTVFSIYVEPVFRRKFSEVKLDMTKFTKTAISPFPHNFSYSNPAEGITYEVDESEDKIRDIEYYASADDCQEVISRRAPIYRNAWRGLVPLHANRRDVEKLLGLPRRSWGATVVYDTDHEAITVKYSEGNCSNLGAGWDVPNNTILELVVGQRLSFLLSRLNLDRDRYERQEQLPLPEIPAPHKVVNYTDAGNGITIRTQSRSGPEEVVSITYRPAAKDEHLRCHKKGKPAGSP